MTQYKKGLDLYHPQVFDIFFSSVRKSNGLVQVLEASHYLTKESSTIYRTNILCKVVFTDERLAEKRTGLKELLNLFYTLRFLYLILHSLKKITKQYLMAWKNQSKLFYLDDYTSNSSDVMRFIFIHHDER